MKQVDALNKDTSVKQDKAISPVLRFDVSFGTTIANRSIVLLLFPDEESEDPNLAHNAP